MGKNMQGKREFSKGTVNYEMQPSGGFGESPKYEVTVNSSVPGDSPEEVLCVKFSGIVANKYSENRALIEAMMDAIENFIMKHEV